MLRARGGTSSGGGKESIHLKQVFGGTLYSNTKMDIDAQNKSVAELRQYLFKLLFSKRFLPFRVKQMEEIVPPQDLVFPLFE